MKEKCENNQAINNYLMAVLLDFFRHPKAAIKVLQAAKIARNVLARDAISHREVLDARFIAYAHRLKDNISVASLRDFTEKCVMAAKKNGALSKAKNPSSPPTIQMLKKRAKEDLTLSMRMGYLEGAAVNRAAYELVKKREQALTKERFIKSIRSHPLRETFEGLILKEEKVAREDIRNVMLRLKRYSSKNSPDGVLFGLLTKTKAFLATHLHQLLGDELFFMCRPTGFLDQQGTTVVVEVPTNAHLHALTYRKLEILRALKQDETFLNAKKIHLKIATTKFE